MDFIEPIELGLKETVITGKFAAKYGYSVGDKLVVHDRSDNEIELVIAGISSNENKNYFISNNTAIVNLETSDIISCGKKDTGLILVNILDNEEAPRGIQMIRDYYPSATVINFMVDESMEETLNQMLMFLPYICRSVPSGHLRNSFHLQQDRKRENAFYRDTQKSRYEQREDRTDTSSRKYPLCDPGQCACRSTIRNSQGSAPGCHRRRKQGRVIL